MAGRSKNQRHKSLVLTNWLAQKQTLDRSVSQRKSALYQWASSGDTKEQGIQGMDQLVKHEYAIETEAA